MDVHIKDPKIAIDPDPDSDSDFLDLSPSRFEAER
jgi:hypothetical protein